MKSKLIEKRYLLYRINNNKAYLVWVTDGKLYAQSVNGPMTTAHLKLEDEIIDDAAIRKAIVKAYGL